MFKLRYSRLTIEEKYDIIILRVLYLKIILDNIKFMSKIKQMNKKKAEGI